GTKHGLTTYSAAMQIPPGRPPSYAAGRHTPESDPGRGPALAGNEIAARRMESRYVPGASMQPTKHFAPGPTAGAGSRPTGGTGRPPLIHSQWYGGRPPIPPDPSAPVDPMRRGPSRTYKEDRMSHHFKACYPGRCAACTEPIVVDDLLTYD